MFINFSNHPSDKWETAQIDAARKYGEIVDIPFPAVSPDGDEEYISKLADDYIERIVDTPGQIEAVMVQGEFNLTYAFVNRLIAKGIKAFSACTARSVKEIQDEMGVVKKESVFQFVRFREYK